MQPARAGVFSEKGKPASPYHAALPVFFMAFPEYAECGLRGLADMPLKRSQNTPEYVQTAACKGQSR